jgi:hypothetical protein
MLNAFLASRMSIKLLLELGCLLKTTFKRPKKHFSFLQMQTYDTTSRKYNVGSDALPQTSKMAQKTNCNCPQAKLLPMNIALQK